MKQVLQEIEQVNFLTYYIKKKKRNNKEKIMVILIFHIKILVNLFLFIIF